ncbi:hypothetical protein [Luedemannella helvata]|uniref:Uncharacterized protein n=1 Tax=Luedemannella helvata TaxID=349315 RepID=A0ABP4XDK6_9ACTN
MTEPAIDLTQRVLVMVGDFLRKLPPAQVADLVTGEARLAVLPKGARVSGPSAAAARRTPATAKPAPASATQISAELAKIDDRAAATRYLNDLKLTVPQYKQVCAELDIPVASSAKRDVVINKMVELLVGRRLDADAMVRRSSAGRV